MTITTERFTLRLLRRDDAPWLAREITNPAVHQWLTAPPRPYGLDDAQAFLARVAPDPGYRAICQGDGLLGVVSIRGPEGVPPDLGYWLAEPAWGKGVMTEAARAMLDWQFAQGTEAVSSGWIIGNEGSENVLRKLGFAETRLKHARSEFFDKLVPVQKVEMTATRWHRLRHAPE